jgi:polyhydroxyalkanoate synthase
MPTARRKRKTAEPAPAPEADGFAAPTEGETQPELDHEQAKAAAEEILGANPLIGIDRGELLDAAQRALRLVFSRPQVLVEENLALGRELLGVLQGSSRIAPDPKDRRFSHEIWQKSGYFKRLMQGFLAWRGSLDRIVERSDASSDDRERAKFIVQLFAEAFAPTNFLLGNPGGIQRARQTKGRSLLYGAQNLIDDLTNNGGMPSMVDERKFQVGKNLAITPGAVVFRSEVLELIQYAPATDKVRREPLLIVPPQINKFYALDLAPGRSFAEYAVQHGIQIFCISWRNPTAAQRDWNMDTYLTACKEALAAVKSITGSRHVHTMAACAGGFTMTTLLSHLAASGDDSVASCTLLVTVLDTEAPTLLGQFASKTGIAAAIQKSRRAGVLEGKDMARVFSWLRPNDLVWLYVANNWVMGNRPPAFDILYWNADSTRLPAEFHADLLRMYLENPLKHAGRLEVLGTKVDLGKVTTPFYIIAGVTDHITPWQACYESRKLIKSPITFILTSSGHVQSIVNPPGNPKAKYFLNPNLKLGAEAWRSGATEHAGSWWEHWQTWYRARSGSDQPAPATLGNADYPAGDAAPGRYVHQR